MKDEGVVAGVCAEEDGEGLRWLLTADGPEVDVVRNIREMLVFLWDGTGGHLVFLDNFYEVGTLNTDETTYSFGCWT